MMNEYLDISPEVQAALKEHKPVVALESTIISHGMPYPQNVETALNVEKIIRENGAVPATIAIIGGRLKAGLSKEEIEHLGKAGTAVTKASRRDLPVLCAKGMDGATTVATTMIIAAMAGISVFATGGVGGVHRGAEVTMDISADLEELGRTNVMVVCAGAKSILDLGLTLEYLETMGVTLLGCGTDRFPGFLTQDGPALENPPQSALQLARTARIKWDVGLSGGLLYCARPDGAARLEPQAYEQAQRRAMDEADRLGVRGGARTPFLLQKILESSEAARGAYEKAVLASARAGAEIAVKYAQL